MSREIKFRAWDRTQAEPKMVEWNQLEGFPVSAVFISAIEVSLMQYTGLKDKNGVEIYEGDIFKRSNGHTSEVSYDNEHACFGLKDKGLSHLNSIDNTNGEIIGNIYEHGNLLK